MERLSADFQTSEVGRSKSSSHTKEGSRRDSGRVVKPFGILA